MNVKEAKRRLREETILKLKELHQTERNSKSKIISKKVLLSRDFEKAQAVMFYAAMTYEVETIDIIMATYRQKKKVILPLLNRNKREITACEIKDFEKETKECMYGFREPNSSLQGNIQPDVIDLVLVPGVCFDRANHRLGHGIGCYDKFLSSLKPSVKKVGLAFDIQLYDEIPFEQHDVILNGVISNN